MTKAGSLWMFFGSTLVAFFGGVAISWSSDNIPVFPGAEGFGTKTPAGRGGIILKVTNLGDAGPGTLRAAIAVTEPRIIVFEVAGTISLTKALIITDPFVTIAGQTAPSPGITLKGAGVTILTHDVLVQHLHIRIGDAPQGPPPTKRDGLEILGLSAFNVVIDHISVSWAIDENLSTWFGSHDLTISHSIISEGLNVSLHPKGPHSKGVLVGDHSKNVSLIGNLLAHNAERNPRIKGDVTAIVVNNLFYNSKGFMSIGSEVGKNTASVVGNIFIAGADTPLKVKPIKVEKIAAAGTVVYLSDNRYLGMNIPDSNKLSVPPIWISPLTIHDSNTLEPRLLARAGARPADRDSVDKRIIEDVIKRTGRVIDSQKQVGGWPDQKISIRPFSIPVYPNKDEDNDGYTNIEEVLHQMAEKVE